MYPIARKPEQRRSINYQLNDVKTEKPYWPFIEFKIKI